jgi:hypothetical protein
MVNILKIKELKCITRRKTVAHAELLQIFIHSIYCTKMGSFMKEIPLALQNGRNKKIRICSIGHLSWFLFCFCIPRSLIR